MDSCWEMGDPIQNVLLVPWMSMEWMVPRDSMIPVNIGVQFRKICVTISIFGNLLYLCSPKNLINHADYRFQRLRKY